MMVTHVGNQNLRVTVQVERGIRGLEPSVVTAFPTVKLGDGGGPQLLPPVPEESQLRYQLPPSLVCLQQIRLVLIRASFSTAHALCILVITRWTTDQVTK
jgi:hypothetical protein